MENQKRMYSLNKIAYLLSQGLEPVEIGVDRGNSAVYYVFPDDDVTARCIRRFYEDKQIHRFIDAFSRVIKTVKTKKQSLG